MEESDVKDFDNVLAADMPLAVSNLNDIKTIVNQVNQMVRNLIDRVKNKELPTAQGMSFLDVKNQLLLKYLMDLNCVLLKKVSGESIKGSSSIGIVLQQICAIETIIYMFFLQRDWLKSELY
jgi:U3 small nucleolar ribonucleoprotein protein LCP5